MKQLCKNLMSIAVLLAAVYQTVSIVDGGVFLKFDGKVPKIEVRFMPTQKTEHAIAEQQITAPPNRIVVTPVAAPATAATWQRHDNPEDGARRASWVDKMLRTVSIKK